MNNPIHKSAIFAASAALIGLVGDVSAATVISAGSDIDVSAAAPGGGGFWRTTTVAKPNDIDGDNILGTDGYRYVTDNAGGNGANDVVSLAPSYATYSLTNTNFRGNAGYNLIDNALAPGTTRSGTFNPTAAPNNAEGAFISFGTISFSRDALANETVRIGLMVDNLDNVIFNSHTLRLSTGGVNTDVNTTAETGTDNQNPDWYYFDVTDFGSGETVEFFATSSEGNPGQTSFPATIGAFSFDSTVVPEPTSAALLALGGLSILARRRR